MHHALLCGLTAASFGLSAAAVVGQTAADAPVTPIPGHALSISTSTPYPARGVDQLHGVQIRADIRSPAPPGTPFQLCATTDREGPLIPLGRGRIGDDGRGSATIHVDRMPALDEMAPVHFRALLATPAGPQQTGWATLGGGAPCEQLSFNYDVESNLLPAGTFVTDQWAEAGLNISATSNDPNGTDTVILFDSGNPTGGDPDLQTPGYGPGNDTALGNLLIIAEDIVDANGDRLVDDPDDDEAGGVIELRWDRDVTMCALGLIDLDKGGVGSTIRMFDAADTLLQEIALPSRGDNSFQEVQFRVSGVRRVEISFVSSGGIPYFRAIPCPTRFDFDSNTFGVPLDLMAGERITDDLAALGVDVSAINANPAHPDEAILLDTGNPTGGDTDLATPGYGVGNNEALGHVLIIAENNVDADGDQLVDVPDDEVAGGILRFDFPMAVTFEQATVIDIDANESAAFVLYDAAGVVIETLPLSPLGDNSVQTLTRNVSGVRAIELRLSSSGALADLRVCPEPVR